MDPSGTVTFLFTDIEGSTAMWDRVPRLMESALARHDLLLRDLFAARGGYLFSTGGDGFAVAFGSAVDAVSAAIDGQQLMLQEPWHVDAIVRVRMGLNTGTAQERDGNYFGAAVSRAARVCAAATGGQIALSASTTALVVDEGWVCVDAGEFSLSGFHRPERLAYIEAPGLLSVGASGHERRELLGNLPRRRAALVGRQDELGRLASVIGQRSLVTVVGVGGVGKTRLALSAAEAAADRFVDGAWLVELAGVSSPDEVLQAVASALDLRLPQLGDGPGALAMALERQNRLIVLDNCEHLLDPVGDVVDAIRDRCSAVSLIVTSRELLGADDECAVPIGPLSVDVNGGVSDAVLLFCERTGALLGSFEPNVAELAVIGDICRRLDGLPLAIELAAARVPSLGLYEIRARLSARFEVVTRRRGAVERQRSLRTTIAWSYDLLTTDEQLLFDRLSVFAGGFDLNASEVICGHPPLTGLVADHVTSLVAKSLLVVGRTDEGIRYHQLETVREYGEEQLEQRDASATTRSRHLAHFVEWVAQCDHGTRGVDEVRWHHRLLADWDNIRAALHWAIDREDAEAASTIIWHLHRWGFFRLRLEIGDWAEQVCAMEAARDHPLHPIVVATAALFAHLRGDYRRAHTLISQAVRDEERLGEAVEPFVPEVSAIVHIGRGAHVTDQAVREIRRRAAGDLYWNVVADRRATIGAFIRLTSHDLSASEALEDLRMVEAIADHAQRFGNPSLSAAMIGNLGCMLQWTEPERAATYLDQALAVGADAGATMIETSFASDLARVMTTLGRTDDAVRQLAAVIRRVVRAGATNQLVDLLPALITPLILLGQAHTAATVYGTLSQFLENTRILTNMLMPPDAEAALRDALGERDFDIARSLGRSNSLTATAELVLATIDAEAKPDHPPTAG